jgi:small subunit ribosomal protein S6
MAIYETIFILDSLMPPKDIDTTIERYSGIIAENGGKVRTVDKWGKRRLAYEIQKKQYGFYVAIEFEGPGGIPKLLEGDYNYNDKVMRYLTYRYDKNKLKAMEMEEKGSTASKMAKDEEPVKKQKEVETEVIEEVEEEPVETETEESPEEVETSESDTEEEASEEEDK